MNRKTLILGGVLLVLIILAYAYQGPLKKWQNSLGKPKNILARIDAAKIDKIEITLAGNAVDLSKQGEKWKYNDSKDFYADQSLMSRALASLKEAAASEAELVSNKRDRKSEFKTDAAGLSVKIYQAGGQTVDFIVGRQISDYSGVYVSMPDSAATYSLKADLLTALTPGEWRDLTIFSTAKEKINKIRFQYPNREFTVALQDGRWSGILPEKFIVNQAKLEKILEIMSGLKAEAIPEQTFKDTGLEKHLIIIEATGNGAGNVLMIGASKGELYYAKRGDSDNIYLIDKATRDELDKWIWQLR
ncbi:MAG: DUF4340 domain-containing protein [Patescibacteria group bacterium]|nr:DUF4340 domain-containing protein [Patescibacteria group bacterium]